MTDIPYMSVQKDKFVTNVGLITTKANGKDNIMAAEWTHHISYSPGIIAVAIGRGKISGENIKHSKVFGVNLAATDQNIVASVAGGTHGQDVDKVSILKEMGFTFSNARKIDVLMVEGSAMQAECKLKEIVDTGGTHILYIGEVVELYEPNAKDSLVYYKKKYWKVGEPLNKPDLAKSEEITNLVKKHSRKS